MTYARQHNDRIQVGLPRTGKLSDGRTVSNYRNLSTAILTSEGWVPYINIRPEVDDGYYAKATGYDVQDNQIVRLYQAALIIQEEIEE